MILDSIAGAPRGALAIGPKPVMLNNLAQPLMPGSLRVVPSSIEQLVRDAAEGDERAFTELYKLHSRYVARIVFRVLGRDDGDVDDIVQQAFLDALRKLDTLRSPGAFRVWVGRIAVNHCSNHIASRRRARAAEGALRLVHDQSPPNLGDGEARTLWSVLERVRAEVRIPWILHKLEQETIEQVAELCDVSPSTAKRRVRECESSLRRMLRD